MSRITEALIYEEAQVPTDRPPRQIASRSDCGITRRTTQALYVRHRHIHLLCLPFVPYCPGALLD